MESQKITKEERKKHIEEVVNYVFDGVEKNKPKERRIVAYSYCKGINGVRNYGTDMEGLCGHPECDNCRSFDKLLQEKLDKQINNLKNG